MTHAETQAEIERLKQLNISRIPEGDTCAGHMVTTTGARILVQTTTSNGQVISSDGVDFVPEDQEMPTYAEIVVAAIQQGKAYRILHWMSADGPAEELVIVDGRKHVERINCVICGERSIAKYSTDFPQRPQDGYESVMVGCNCRGIAYHIKSENFAKARGAMTSAAGGAWNRWNDPHGHPDDFKNCGGIVVDAHAVDLLMDEKNGSPNGG